MKRRLLVVEDEAAILSALEIAHEESGFELVAVDSAEKAIDALSRTSFDAVLLDKNLPGKSGLDLVQWIRVRNRTVPLVVMTAYASSESATIALNLGIDSLIEKPFPNVMEVPALMKRLVEGRTGWLPGHAELRFATPSPGTARPLRILLGASKASGETLGDPAFTAAPAGSTLVRHETLAQLLAAFDSSPRPDLVLLDADFYPALTHVIEALFTRHEAVEIAVISSRALTVGVLQELILLGVTQIVDRASGDYEAQVARVVRGLRA